LAGGIAHDFNNILGAMLGYTQLSLIDKAINEKSKSYLDQVLKAGQRATTLVKHILAFSRQTEQVFKPIGIGPIVKEALNLLRASLPSSINIIKQIDAHTGTVLADPTQIHQVLINLCTNAAQAMGEKGGVLTVELKETKLSRNENLVFEAADGVYVLIKVSDTGPGIDPAIRDGIFEPYFSTKAPGQGTGLGLATIHGIIKGHRGAIKVESEPGQGSAFSVYIPRIKEEAVKDKQLTSPLEKGTERILLVDDESALVEFAKSALEYLGYTVDGCTNSLEALKKFKSRPQEYDLVITDYTMPNLLGLDLATEMLKISPNLPILLCTGFSATLDAEKVKAAGIKALVPKP
ncbi:MAG: ATP-binding protein, partial [Syntrophales bacterium LBB04]|nr:ATP-binding protein [Syntrophales bacterium LBB04]